ncbi:MAG: ABC transporter substrate-binding protein [Candidatus Eisenbacteria bacterium]
MLGLLARQREGKGPERTPLPRVLSRGRRAAARWSCRSRRSSLHPLQGRNDSSREPDGSTSPLLRLESRGARPPAVLATSRCFWDWSSADRTLTVRMRGYRVWEDTTRINARDVMESYDAYLKAGLFGSAPPKSTRPAVGAREGVPAAARGLSPLPRSGSPLLRVEALDDSTVRFAFRGDVSEWRAWEIASHPILAASWLEKRPSDAQAAALSSGPPPSGAPFRIPQNLTGKNLTLRANPLLPYGARPWVRRLLLEPCPGPDSRVLRVAMNRADYVNDVPVFQLANWIGNDAPVAMRRGAVASVEMLVLKSGDPTLPPALREALDLSLDRERLLKNLLTYRGEVYGGMAAGLLEPGGPPAPPPIDSVAVRAKARRDSLLALEDSLFVAQPETLSASARLDSLLRASPPPRLDLTRARALLDQMGLKDTDGDGLRGRFAAGDSSFILETPVKLRVLYDRSNEFRERLLTFVEEDLFALGILLEPEPVDAETFFRRYEAGEFQAALLGFRPPPTPDLTPLWASWGRWNGGGYDNLTVDGLLNAALRSDDPARVEALNREIEARVRRDRPALFLIYRQEVDLVGPRVRGWEEGEGDLLGRLAHVWLADTTDLPSLGELAARGESLRVGAH